MGGSLQSAGSFAAQNPDMLLRLGAQTLNPRIRPIASIGAGVLEQSMFPQRAKDWFGAQQAVEAAKAGKTQVVRDPGIMAEGVLETEPVRATMEQRMQALRPPRTGGEIATSTTKEIITAREEEEKRRRLEEAEAMRPLGSPVMVTAPPRVPGGFPGGALGARQPSIEDLIRLLMQRRGGSRGVMGGM
mgnify:CR=1 FL=1